MVITFVNNRRCLLATLNPRGEVKIDWLQPPYSVAVAVNLHTESYAFIWDAVAFWLQPGVGNFDISLFVHQILTMTRTEWGQQCSTEHSNN